MTLTARFLPAVIVAVAAGALLAGCGAESEAGEPAAPSSPAAQTQETDDDSPTTPDPDAGFDYQLGGPYAPPAGVTTVERDLTEEPAGLGYDICYVNGFQTQPDASALFAAEHPELLVQDAGEPLADPGWPDEYLFDTSTPENRDALAALVGGWIAGCADAGYDAVEIDNLDSYTRSGGALAEADNLALAVAFAEAAHREGLAIAQKNTAELAGALADRGYDFAVTESCYEFEECGAYSDAYPAVLDIEYTDELGEDAFAEACDDPDRPGTMILRDHDLVTPDDPAYRYSSCAA